MTRPAARALTLGCATGLLGLAASLVPWVLELEENAGLAWLFTLRGPLPQPADVAVISIDGESSDELGLPSRPDRWPRSLHADLIDRLSEAGVSVVAFDVMFNVPRVPGEDHKLADSIRRAGNVILLERVRSETIAMSTPDGQARTVQVDRRIPPIPMFKEGVLGSAPFPLPTVPVRVNQFWAFGRSASDIPTLPTLALKAHVRGVYDEFLALLRERRPEHAGSLPANAHELVTGGRLERTVSEIRRLFEEDRTLAEEIAEDLRSAGYPDGSREKRLLQALINLYQGPAHRYLNYYGPQRSILTVPYHRALELAPGDPIARDLAGRAVFVGFSETQQSEQQDAFYSVFSQRSGLNLGGVEIAATAFANLLDSNTINPMTMPVHLSLVFGWGLLVGGGLAVLPTALGLGAAGLAWLLYLGAAFLRFESAGVWMPLMVPLFLQLPAGLFAVVVWNYARARSQAQRVQQALGYYLPARVVQQLARETVDLRRDAQLLHGTCLVTDAEQYTALSEAMSPQALRDLMNDYFDVLFEPVTKHGGFVSDIVGDSMVAVWATAEPDARARASACRASIEMMAETARFNRRKGQQELPTRIGLHSGEILLGSVGARSHFEYRAIGDIVNTASRIQGLNKQLGTRLLVSEATVGQLQDFHTRELGEFLLAGKRTPLVVHELMELRDPSSLLALKQDFERALSAFKNADWNGAAHGFLELLQRFPDDGPTRFYLQLSQRYTREPPHPDWRGAIPIKEK